MVIIYWVCRMYLIVDMEVYKVTRLTQIFHIHKKKFLKRGKKKKVPKSTMEQPKQGFHLTSHLCQQWKNIHVRMSQDASIYWSSIRKKTYAKINVVIKFFIVLSVFCLLITHVQKSNFSGHAISIHKQVLFFHLLGTSKDE